MTAVEYAAVTFFGMLGICAVIVVCIAGLAWIVSIVRHTFKDAMHAWRHRHEAHAAGHFIREIRRGRWGI